MSPPRRMQIEPTRREVAPQRTREPRRAVQVAAPTRGLSGWGPDHDTSSLLAHQNAHESRPRSAGGPAAIHRCATTDPVIRIDDFVRYVEGVEDAYPSDSPEQIVTRLRELYYGSIPFSILIPMAPGVHPPGLNDGDLDGETRDRLTSHADENSSGDNPSPYVLLPNGERVDVGHMLLGLDALLHPTTIPPYSSFGMSNIDPSSWVADLGIASVWWTMYERGTPHGDMPRRPSSPTLEAFYQMSAPVEDILGDADSFGLHAHWESSQGGFWGFVSSLLLGPDRLSEVLRGYYLGSGRETVSRRWQTFCARNGLLYTSSTDGRVTWDTSWHQALIARIDRFNDLYGAGTIGAVTGTARRVFSTVPPGQWPHTGEVLDRFLSDVKRRLEVELSASRRTRR